MSDFRTPKRGRSELEGKYEEKNEEKWANNSALISGKSGFTKLQRKVVFKNMEKFGSWTPTQKHFARIPEQIGWNANTRLFKPKQVISLQNIENAMFTQRYFLEMKKNVGTLSLGGITSEFIMSVDSSDAQKSIFRQNVAIDMGAITSDDNIPYRDRTVNTNLLKDMWPMPNAIIDIKASTSLIFRNNGTYPAILKVMQWKTRQDNVANTDLPTEMEREAGNDWYVSHTNNEWGGGDTAAAEATPVAFNVIPQAPYFEFMDLPAGGSLDKQFKFYNVKYVQLAPGESATTKLEPYETTFNLKAAVNRMRLQGYDPTVGGVSTVMLAGINQGYLLTGHGVLAHQTEGPTVGWTQGKIDMMENTRYEWKMKGQKYVTLYSVHNPISGSATIITEPFAPGNVS